MKADKLRARVLAEWRGLPEANIAVDRSMSVGDAVRKVMTTLGLKDRLRSEEVLAAWGEIVGEFLARHSRPQRLKDGILFVDVLQPTVRFAMEESKTDIREKLRTRFGKSVVREIKFRLG